MNDVRMREFGQNPFLHVKLIIHILMTLLDFLNGSLFSQFYGIQISRAFEFTEVNPSKVSFTQIFQVSKIVDE